MYENFATNDNLSVYNNLNLFVGRLTINYVFLCDPIRIVGTYIDNNNNCKYGAL